MKKWLLCLLAMPTLAFAQFSTTVGGNVKTISPNLPPNTMGSYVEFALVNCGNNTPMVNGVAVLTGGPVDFFADGTGAITAAANSGIQPMLYGNDAILCGASQTSRYSVRFFVGGIATGPAKFYYVASNVPFNLSTAQPITLLPPLVYPNTTVCPPGSYQSGINRDLSVQCRNLPDGASNAVVTNPSATQEIGAQPLILDGAFTTPSVNGVLYSRAGDTVASIEAACTSACTYMVTTPQSITLTANHTLSSNVSLEFANSGSWTVSGAFTLTIPAQVWGTLTQHFGGAAHVKFGTKQTYVPVEWFGAVGDFSGTGTDNTVALQAALDSLSNGQILLQQGKYAISNTLNINKSNVGIKGTIPGGVIGTSGIAGTLSPSVIINTSATADTVDVAGTSPTGMVLYNQFDHFALERSVVPTLFTSAGLSLNYVGGSMIEYVQSQDSGRNFYFHASPGFGIGIIKHTWAGWGYLGVTETNAIASLTGYYLDSADGLAENSIGIDESAATSNLANNVLTYGLYIQGSAINDVSVTGFGAGTLQHSVFINYNGPASGIGAQDIHIVNAILDGCYVDCINVSGINPGARASVDFDGGWANAQSIAANTPVINLFLDSNVAIRGMQISNNNATGYGILLNQATGNTISDNTFIGTLAKDMFLESAPSNVISGNNMNNTATTAIDVINGSGHNTMIGNTIGGSVTTGFNFSSDSQFNVGAAYDNANLATNPFVDAGGLNAAFIPVVELTGTGTATVAVQAGAGTGATATLGTGSNDFNGTITVVTGTSPSANVPLARITFGTAKHTSPVFSITPGNAAAGGLGVWTNGPSNAVVSLNSGTSAPAASTTYIWSYVVTGLSQ